MRSASPVSAIRATLPPGKRPGSASARAESKKNPIVAGTNTSEANVPKKSKHQHTLGASLGFGDPLLDPLREPAVRGVPACEPPFGVPATGDTFRLGVLEPRPLRREHHRFRATGICSANVLKICRMYPRTLVWPMVEVQGFGKKTNRMNSSALASKLSRQ